MTVFPLSQISFSNRYTDGVLDGWMDRWMSVCLTGTRPLVPSHLASPPSPSSSVPSAPAHQLLIDNSHYLWRHFLTSPFLSDLFHRLSRIVFPSPYPLLLIGSSVVSVIIIIIIIIIIIEQSVTHNLHYNAETRILTGAAAAAVIERIFSPFSPTFKTLNPLLSTTTR